MKDFEQLYAAGGALESPFDERDYQLDTLVQKAVNLPPASICKYPPIIANQQSVGCCVGCTLAQIKHFQEYKEIGDESMFSAAYIYANRKEDDYQGSGMYPREALQNLVEYGMCHNKDFPYYAEYEYEDAKQAYSLCKKELDKKAKPYRIASYYRLNDLEDIKIALYTIGYCQICYPVYKCFYEPDEKGMINYNPFLKGKNYGGHSVTCAGYDDEKQALLIVNSWGEDYGVSVTDFAFGGCIWVPYDYPFTEAWAVIDAKTEKELINEYSED